MPARDTGMRLGWLEQSPLEARCPASTRAPHQGQVKHLYKPGRKFPLRVCARLASTGSFARDGNGSHVTEVAAPHSEEYRCCAPCRQHCPDGRF